MLKQKRQQFSNFQIGFENTNENAVQLPKEVETPTKSIVDPNDPFRLFIRKTFSSKIQSALKLKAMCHLCQKLDDFKLSRSQHDS